MAIGGKRQQESTDAPDAQLTVTGTGNATATSGATAVTGYRSPHPETNGAPTIPGVSRTGDATATEGGLANTGYIHTNQLTVVQRRWPREPAAWPHQIGVIPSKAQAFQHRSEANWLRAAIDGGGTAVLGQILTGMGGVGKTQLAADYARTTWKDGSLDLLVWVTASGRSPVVSGYAQAGVELCRANPEDPEQAARAFLAWLTPKAAAEPCRWLIVLDDIADPDDLRDLWPPASPYGRTLATTRRRDAALTSEGRRRIEVGLFTATESITYLSAFLAGHGRHEPPASSPLWPMTWATCRLPCPRPPRISSTPARKWPPTVGCLPPVAPHSLTLPPTDSQTTKPPRWPPPGPSLSTAPTPSAPSV